jgi:two-component system response regulator DesR
VRVLVVQADRRLAETFQRIFAPDTPINVAFGDPSTLAHASNGAFDVVLVDPNAPSWPPEIDPERVTAVIDARILLLSPVESLGEAVGLRSGVPRPMQVPITEIGSRITALTDRKAKLYPARSGDSPSRLNGDVVVLRPIRLVIAESCALYSGALHAMLSSERDMEVVGTLEVATDLPSAAIRAGADIALLDLDAPDCDAPALCQKLHQGAPTCRVIAFTARNLPDAKRRALSVHTHGLVNKKSGAAILLDAVRRVAAGERVVDPRFSAGDSRSLGNTLTLRELDLLRRAANGNSVRELAEQLSLSPGTARNYLSRIMKKLGARNRIEAIRIARDAGWL